jgi:hypothetical protein
MSNLIVAVISIAFAALIMTAGMNYLSPTHAIINTEATNSTIEIDQMLADYNSLKMNVGNGQLPGAEEYSQVYGADPLTGKIQTPNGTYIANGGQLVRTSFLQSIPQINPDISASHPVGDTVTTGWVLIQGCNGLKDANGNAMDCFQMTVNNNAPGAQLTCQALALAQTRLAGNSMAMIMENPDGKTHSCN